MPSSKEQVIEPHARYIGGATIFINADGSWSIGPNSGALVPIQYANIAHIDDDTFGFSQLAAEPDGNGGYRLWVRSDSDNNTIVEVNISAQGKADPASVKVLTPAQLYAVETQFKVDLNDNGGFGGHSVLLEGGPANLYMSADGAYQLSVGSISVTPKTMTVGGAPLTDKVLPPGWSIVKVEPAGSGFTAYAQDASGAVFSANFDANAAFLGGNMLSASDLNALEASQGIDIDGNESLPAPAGWTSAIKDPAIRALVDSALAGGPARPLSATDFSATAVVPTTGAISYTEMVTMLQGIITTHQTAGNTPISADEVVSLQALAARGKAAFSDTAAGSSDYLAYVFSKMVNGSEANRFFTGGATKASELGSLSADSSLAQFQQLVDKWVLGGDMPDPSTGGDSANPKAKAASAVYIQSTGSLFVDGITLSDVNQGSAGDCYLIADLAGVAGTTPSLIQSMIIENPAVNGVRTWGVRFYDTKGQANWVTVNDMLPTRLDDNTKLAYAGSADKSINGEIWVPLIEKAYAQANTLGILPRSENNGKNSFMAVEGGGGDPIVQMAPGKATQYSVVSDPAKAGSAAIAGNDYVMATGVLNSDTANMSKLLGLLKTASNSGQMVWLGVTTTVKDSFGNSLLVGGHAHYALDADLSDPNNETVLVYNPWGLKDLPNPPGPTDANFLSPVPYTLTQLMGVVGLDFVITQPPG